MEELLNEMEEVLKSLWTQMNEETKARVIAWDLFEEEDDN